MATTVSMSKQGRFTFTHTQLEQYFDRIALPQSTRVFDISKIADDEKLSYLKTLVKHQQVRIPFENLEYVQGRTNLLGSK
jgi:arylamine N-acetyltransferase